MDHLLPHYERELAFLRGRSAEFARQYPKIAGRLMLSGCSSKEIARKLEISVETVKVHKKHMYSKLGIKSQSELFSIFLQAQNA